MAGLFITFEGVEGAGKTTQVARLCDVLQAEGARVFSTREPGGHPVAEAIRGVLLATVEPVDPRTELLLFLAARAQLVESVLRPRLAAGEVVLCDRYVDSTLAYQGYARDHDLAMVRRLNAFATGGLMPDLTILLDLPAEAGLARQTERNRMEAEGLEFHRRVRDAYLAEARLDAGRFRVIDAARPADSVHADIVSAVHGAMGGPGT